MKFTLPTIKSITPTKLSNAFLLFITGFLFSLVMLVNTLYTKHPHGGWETEIGMFTTSSILNVLLVAFCVCLFVLFRTIGFSLNIEKRVSSS